MRLPFTSQLNEAGNGALMVITIFVATFFAQYILKAYQGSKSFYHFYGTAENKAAVAVFTMSVGGGLKCWSEWWFMHLRNHHDGIAPVNPFVVPAFIVGTLIALWGFACFARALIPLRYSTGSWLALCAFALIFGIFFAL